MGYNLYIRADLKLVSFFYYLVFVLFFFKMGSFLQYSVFFGEGFCTKNSKCFVEFILTCFSEF